MASVPRYARQLLRFTMVGITSNVAGYLLYLLVTFLGATPKLTMSVFYFVGATIGFWGNRTIAFAHKGSLTRAGLRYLLAHCAGYLLNLSMLTIFVDRLGFAHQWVQAAAIGVVAAFLFVAFKFYVFPAPRSGAGARN